MNRLTHSALATCLLLLGGCSSDTQESKSPTILDAPAVDDSAPIIDLEIPEDAPTVVFLGDSLGAGLHLAEQRAFPAILQARLFETGVPFRLVNASESGRTTAGGVTALDWVLRSKPDVLVIELGGNDGLRGVPVAEIEENLRRLIDGARDANATVLLLGVRLPPNYGEYGAEFDSLFPRLAKEHDLVFAPYFMEDVGGVAEQNLGDGLHPTTEGQERLAENILPSLKRSLERAASKRNSSDE